MRRLQPDFRTLRGPRRWVWAVPAVAAAVASVALVQVVFPEQDLALTTQTRIAGSRELAASGERQQGIPYLASAAGMLNEAAPLWPELLVALETVKVDGVSLVTADINPAEVQVRIEVQFERYDLLLQYIDHLNLGEPATRWVLVQAETNRGAGSRSVARIRAAIESPPRSPPEPPRR